jgi:hypothetical protein
MPDTTARSRTFWITRTVYTHVLNGASGRGIQSPAMHCLGAARDREGSRQLFSPSKLLALGDPSDLQLEPVEKHDENLEDPRAAEIGSAISSVWFFSRAV